LAQEEEPSSAAELAKELSNPNTTLGMMAFPIDFVMFNGDLPDASKQFSTTINFQPSLPISLSPGVNLFVRPMIPVILSTPIIGATGFDQKGFNLGNIWPHLMPLAHSTRFVSKSHRLCHCLGRNYN